MRARCGIKFALFSSLIAGTVAAADSAAAQTEPVIVVPGRPGVPVMMNGVDVSGAIIEGEFGLNRPDSGYPRTVIMRYWPPDHYRNPGAYFPATGHKPQYGRQEVIPPADRQMPVRAKPYYRDWMIESAPGPASTPVPYDPAAANGGAPNGGALNGGAAIGGAVNGGAVNGGAALGAPQGTPPAAAAQSSMFSPARREGEERRREEGKTRRGDERERTPPGHFAPPPPRVHPAPPAHPVHPVPPRPRVHLAPRPRTP
jgi:hypothetical protein